MNTVNTKTAVRGVLGFLVVAALVMVGRLVPHEAFESTAAFALGYSLFAALIPLLALTAEDDDRKITRVATARTALAQVRG